MDSQFSHIFHLIDDYSYACLRYYLNDNKLIDDELHQTTIANKFAILAALIRLVGGSK